MKILKITLTILVGTMLFSTIKTFATSPWTFAGITISKSSTNYPYISSAHDKQTTSAQSFHLSSCKDKILWEERNMDLAIRSNGTSAHTSIYKEIEVGDTYEFVDKFTKIQDNFSLVMKISNQLVSSIYFSGT